MFGVGIGTLFLVDLGVSPWDVLHDALAEAADLDLNMVRGQRDGQLRGSDWTQIGDAALGDHTAEEWQAYRQLLRDIPQTHSRMSEVVWPLDPPTATEEA